MGGSNTPPPPIVLVKPAPDCDQALLPQFFPVALYDDMPVKVKLVIHPSTATEVTLRWKGDNTHGNFDGHSYSLEVTF